VRIEDIFGGGGGGGVGDMFGDLFGRVRGGGAQGRRRPTRGADAEGEVTIDFGAAVTGTTMQLAFGGNGKTVTVRIPPGAEEGSRVRIAGQGSPAPSADGQPGDLLLTIHVRPHAFFKREGDDLHLDLPLTIAEAWRGAKVRVPTFDGDVTMKVPARAQSGQTMRLKGRGVARKGREAGDLYVHFQIVLPTSDDADVEEAIEAIAKHQPDDPRAKIVV
jgi:curved DNA-binding protein